MAPSPAVPIPLHFKLFHSDTVALSLIMAFVWITVTQSAHCWASGSTTEMNPVARGGKCHMNTIYRPLSSVPLVYVLPLPFVF